MKSSSELSQIIADKEKKLMELNNQEHIVEQEILKHQREILNLQLKKKDLEQALSKAKHNTRQMKLEISTVKSNFWNTKNQGL